VGKLLSQEMCLGITEDVLTVPVGILSICQHADSCLTYKLFTDKIYYKNTRQFTYKRNILAPLRNHERREKTLSITYSECMSLALGIQHAMRIRRIVICDLSATTIFTHITS
jgi:hypothetical protein